MSRPRLSPAPGRGDRPLRQIVLLMLMLLVADLRLFARPLAEEESMPFGQLVNLAALRAVTAAPPAALIATMQRWGIEVMQVRSQPPAAAPNPLLAGLPVAGPALLQRAGFEPGYEGRVVCRDERTPQRLDLILIRDHAATYTLLHEFVHAMLRPDCPEPIEDSVIEARFRLAFHRLTVYQRRLYDDPYRLLDPRWRRDILAAQADVVRDLHDRIRLGQSQEVIAEKLLRGLVDAGSPYFDAARQEEGRRYAEAMIDNAIDLFDTVEASRDFVAGTVAQLRAAIRRGELRPSSGEALGEADAAAVQAAAAALAEQLAPTRAALQALKDFHRR
ncbi:MAG: hypothetical protein L6Q75_07775 [Burkholderiaceae bacterium]|nr:hypothetical protein [Burkholderiaceae bacterium]